MPEPRIIRATPGDVHLLNSISLAAKQHWNYPEAWIAHWQEELQVSEAYVALQQVYKMVLGRAIIGFIALEQENNLFEIAHLWIVPAYIGKGYGKRLLTSVLALVVPPGARLLVTADPYAEGFYLRQGFTTIDKQESYPPGRFLPVMEKTYLPPEP